MSPRSIHRNPAKSGPANPRKVAHAPYNFIPLPDKAATFDVEEVANHDRFLTDNNHATGRIHCTIKVKTPLYIRGAIPLSDFKKADQKNKEKDYRDDRTDFFRDPRTGHPMIPGSSLRGMLRTMVEVISSSKFGPVSDRAVYFRSLADINTIREQYQDTITTRRAGWIIQKDNHFAILPVPEVQGRTFFRVGDRYAREKGIQFVSLIEEVAYQKQGLQVVPVYFRAGPDERVEDISPKNTPGLLPGVMVCSGPMGKPTKPRSKQNHWVIPQIDLTSHQGEMELAQPVIDDYLNSLTEYQKMGCMDKENGVLKHGQPVFYVVDDENKIMALGHTANFRLPYLRPGSKRAASLQEMVPEDLDPNAPENEARVDFAEAIFGYVKSKNVSMENRARAGRVRVSDARMEAPSADPWLERDFVIPKILSGPKPTSYQHYLTQPTPDEFRWTDPQGRNRRRIELSHYGSASNVAEPRGHKMYWHQSHVQEADDFRADDNEVKEHPKQYTRIRPIKPGIRFSFDIHFENLTRAELGALLWALTLPGPAGVRFHRLGMCKPLGLGSIAITPELYLENRQERYQTIWNADGSWACPEQLASDDVTGVAIQAFEAEVMKRLGKAGQNFQQEPRIQMLYAMLAWPGPDAGKIGYMSLEDFKERSVLPDPLHLDGLTTPDPQAKPGRPTPPARKPGGGFNPPERKSINTDQRKPAPRDEIPEVRERPSRAAEDLFKKLFGGSDEDQ